MPEFVEYSISDDGKKNSDLLEMLKTQYLRMTGTYNRTISL